MEMKKLGTGGENMCLVHGAIRIRSHGLLQLQTIVLEARLRAKLCGRTLCQSWHRIESASPATRDVLADIIQGDTFLIAKYDCPTL